MSVAINDNNSINNIIKLTKDTSQSLYNCIDISVKAMKAKNVNNNDLMVLNKYLDSINKFNKKVQEAKWDQKYFESNMRPLFKGFEKLYKTFKDTIIKILYNNFKDDADLTVIKNVYNMTKITFNYMKVVGDYFNERYKQLQKSKDTLIQKRKEYARQNQTTSVNASNDPFFNNKYILLFEGADSAGQESFIMKAVNYIAEKLSDLGKYISGKFSPAANTANDQLSNMAKGVDEVRSDIWGKFISFWTSNNTWEVIGGIALTAVGLALCIRIFNVILNRIKSMFSGFWRWLGGGSNRSGW